MEVIDIRSLNGSIINVFQEAQFGLSGHRKLVVNLKSILNKSVELGYEESFIYQINKLINKILDLKKGETAGDRIVKFIASFLRSLQQDIAKKNEGKNEDDEEEDEPVANLVDNMLRHLSIGMRAKNRNVRYRVVQILSYVLAHIGDIDLGLCQAIVDGLYMSLQDKEQNVRLNGVIAISHFQDLSNEHIKEIGRYENKDHLSNIKESERQHKERLQKYQSLSFATRLLIDTLNEDESPEIRRAALLNVAKNKITLPYIFESARDVNPTNRRLFYSRFLKEIDLRDINNLQLSKFVSYGLNDRSDQVRLAAIKTFNYWFQTVFNKNFTNFINTFTIEELNTEEIKNIDKLLKEIFQLNFELVKSIEIDNWRETTIDKLFFIRNLFEFLNDNKYFSLIDEKFIEPIELSEIIFRHFKQRNSIIEQNKDLINKYKNFEKNQKNYQNNLDDIEYEYSLIVENEELDSEEVKLKANELDKTFQKILADKEQEMIEFKPDYKNHRMFQTGLKSLEIIINNFLKISLNYDYSDEISRRGLLQIVRSSVTNDYLSDETVELCLKIINKLSINEKEFVDIVIEAITDIRDSQSDENDETFHSAISGFIDDDDDEDEDDDDDDEEEGEEILQDDYTNNINRIGNVFDNENFTSSVTPKRKRRKIQPKEFSEEVVSQGLITFQYLLELIDSPIQNNMVDSIVETLVRQGIQKLDEKVGECSIRCMSLLALFKREEAIRELNTFMIVMSRYPQSVGVVALKAIFDILSTFGSKIFDFSYLTPTEVKSGLESRKLITSKDIAKALVVCLESTEHPIIQTIAAEGLCKLYLADIMDDYSKYDHLVDEEADEESKQILSLNLLLKVILAYFNPKNKANNEFKQTLTFCLPVYAFSHGKHQQNLCKISADILLRLSEDGNEDFENEIDKISLTTIIQQLIHWCDPSNLVNKETDEYLINSQIQAKLFLESIRLEYSKKQFKKTIISNLPKIHIDERIGSESLTELLEDIDQTIETIDDRKEEPDFSIDNYSLKSLTKFRDIVEAAKEKAFENEANQGDMEVEEIEESEEDLQQGAGEVEQDNDMEVKEEDSIDEHHSQHQSHRDEAEEEGEQEEHDDMELDQHSIKYETDVMNVDVGDVSQDIESELKSIDEFLDAQD
ncbi:condensin complex subunit 3 [[Candida] jaroonii]|uniref:Condensin complex subunit 3 n=1 Tax=[Candida] jaroonii TaxID=467808 RepID=A0ACA9YA27_9ASCO|nr:condensin complex subunit 3 [[Candida] jaroonii]